MKLKIFLFTACFILFFGIFANAQESPVFDLIWSTNSKSPYGFSGKILIYNGSSVFLTAQPNQRVNLNDYSFKWVLEVGNRASSVKTADKNYFKIDNLDAALGYKITVNIYKNKKFFESHSKYLKIKNDEFFLYRKIPNQKTFFYYKKNMLSKNVERGALYTFFPDAFFGQKTDYSFKIGFSPQKRKVVNLREDFTFTVPEKTLAPTLKLVVQPFIKNDIIKPEKVYQFLIKANE